VDDVEKNTQSVLLTMSATPVSAGVGRVRPMAAIGAAIPEHVELSGRGAAVRTAPTHNGVMREKSALLLAKRVQTVLRDTQLTAYGFGTPVGVDVPTIDVATGVPPRSRPV